MATLTVVFNTATPQFLENRIFDLNYAARFPGGLTLPLLYEEVVRRGWKMVTADMFLASPSHAGLTVCLSEMFTPFTNRLLARGVIPAVIFSGESPNVAWNFYNHLNRYTSRYRHTILFRGVQNEIKSPTQFHPYYWTNALRNVLPGPRWIEREFLVIVSSNKQRFQVSLHKPLLRVRQFVKQMIFIYLKAANPLFRFMDLYQKRLDAIQYFAETPGFRLFGSGWDQPYGLSRNYYQAVKRSGAVPVEDKLGTMSGFKFALSFENCVFPGYVTEKIFDCFFSGCIPIYWGAPDITDFVPADTFVDARQFRSWVDLARYMREMSESDAQGYLKAARDFLASDAFARFHQDYFVEELIGILEEEFFNAT